MDVNSSMSDMMAAPPSRCDVRVYWAVDSCSRTYPGPTPGKRVTSARRTECAGSSRTARREERPGPRPEEESGAPLHRYDSSRGPAPLGRRLRRPACRRRAGLTFEATAWERSRARDPYYYRPLATCKYRQSVRPSWARNLLVPSRGRPVAPWAPIRDTECIFLFMNRIMWDPLSKSVK